MRKHQSRLYELSYYRSIFVPILSHESSDSDWSLGWRSLTSDAAFSEAEVEKRPAGPIDFFLRQPKSGVIASDYVDRETVAALCGLAPGARIVLQHLRRQPGGGQFELSTPEHRHRKPEVVQHHHLGRELSRCRTDLDYSVSDR